MRRRASYMFQELEVSVSRNLYLAFDIIVYVTRLRKIDTEQCSICGVSVVMK